MLVTPFKASDIAQILGIQVEALGAMIVCQSQDPVLLLSILCILRVLIAIAILADAKRLARFPNVCAELADCVFRHLPTV